MTSAIVAALRRAGLDPSRTVSFARPDAELSVVGYDSDVAVFAVWLVGAGGDAKPITLPMQDATLLVRLLGDPAGHA